MEEYINLFENVIAKTSPKVDYMDIRFGMGDNTSILMKDGNVDEINTGMSLGARIRVLNNGAWGFAYTTDLSNTSNSYLLFSFSIIILYQPSSHLSLHGT